MEETSLTHDATDLTLLVANDSSLETRILIDNVISHGCRFTEIFTAKTGENALDIIMREQPDLVFLDWTMPGLEGPEICRMIHRSTAWRDRKRYSYIILTTSRNSKKSLLEGLSSGADDFISKPLDLEEVIVRARIGMRIVNIQKELQRQKKELENLALTDSLAGIYNRKAIMERIEKALSSGRRLQRKTGLAMCDIDHFKDINDFYGHLAGDFIIKELGRFFSENLRDGDDVGRYGGDEYICLFPETDEEQLITVIKRLLIKLEKKTFHFEGKRINISLSIGAVSSVPPDRGSIHYFLSKSDEGLYQAKRQGRGCACFWVKDRWLDFRPERTTCEAAGDLPGTPVGSCHTGTRSATAKMKPFPGE